jgi:hypothetical protein
MSEQKRSAEEQIADEADRKARNPTAARQKISEGQAAPEFQQNHERLKAERLARGRAEDKKMRAARLKELEECGGSPRDRTQASTRTEPPQRASGDREISCADNWFADLRSAYRKQKSKKS